MIDLTAPAWSGPIGTGLFGTAYGLGGERALVLVSSLGSDVGSHPDRTWAWIIMNGRARDFAFEESLKRNKDLASLTGVQILGNDQLFTAREIDLGTVFRIVREAVQGWAGSHPDRKTSI